MSAFKSFTMIQLSCENEREEFLPDCRVGVKESESKDNSNMNALAASMATYIMNYGTSLTVM